MGTFYTKYTYQLSYLWNQSSIRFCSFLKQYIVCFESFTVTTMTWLTLTEYTCHTCSVIIFTFWFFPRWWFITEFIARVIRLVQLGYTLLRALVPSQGHYSFHSFRLLTDFVCLYTYAFWLSLFKLVRSSVILLLSLFVDRCSFFFFWPSYCQFFFDLRHLIAPLISSNCFRHLI